MEKKGGHRCVSCRMDEESIDYILLGFSIATMQGFLFCFFFRSYCFLGQVSAIRETLLGFYGSFC